MMKRRKLELSKIKRRQFLRRLTALGGSYILTACGDGSGSAAGVGSTSTAAVLSPEVSSANAIVAAASASSTTIPPATSITDITGAVWTIAHGSAYRNGAMVGVAYNVTLILFYGNSIYCELATNQFYNWLNSAWVACSDPRLGGTSVDGTSIPSATYIVDKNWAVWTVVGGVIYCNGATVGNTYAVSLLLWYGGMLYACASGGNFWVYSNAKVWTSCNDPRIPLAAVAGTFYGMNGHSDYTYTPAQIVSCLKTLGCTIYRVGCTTNPVQLNATIALAKAFQVAGLTLFVLIEQGMYDVNGNLYSSESVAYAQNQASAAIIANALMQYGVTLYECGNELTRDPGIIVNTTYAGTNIVDFQNANWPLMRGAMGGMIAGVKSVQPNAKCGINFCVADVGASDALWDGIQPDGTTGHAKVRWDLTTWHNYQIYGDILDIGTDGSGPGFDLITYCKARYGVPFLITEWNASPQQTEAYRATYITSEMGALYQVRKTHYLQSIMYYVLDSGDNTYGIILNGVPINPPFSTFQSFVAANSDT